MVPSGLGLGGRSGTIGRAIGRVLVAAIVGGCAASTATPSLAPTIPTTSSLPSPTTALTPGPSFPADSPWQTELDDLRPDGTRSVDSALRLFAMAFGPIPGVAAPAAAPGAVDSASPAVRVLRAHLPSLPTEQRQAIERDLDLPDAADPISIPASPGVSAVDAELVSAHLAGSSRDRTEPDRPYTDFRAEITDEARRAHDQAEQYFGPMPTLKLLFRDEPDALFITYSMPALDGCDVVVNLSRADVDRFQTRRALTIDIVHCYQGWFLGNDPGRIAAVPAWAFDGPAEFTSLELWPPFDEDAAAWARYLTKPDVSLFARGDDAVGFFAQADRRPLPHATAFKTVLAEAAGGEAGQFAAMGTATPDFLDSWASELSRLPWPGPWDFSGPGFPDASVAAPREPLAIAKDVSAPISQAPYSNHLFAVHSTADIVEVNLDGHGRIGDGTVDSTDLSVAYFCTTDRGCGPCPDGSDPSIHPTRLAPESVLAINGGTERTEGAVSGHDLAEYCKASPPSANAVQVQKIVSEFGTKITIVDLVSCDGPWGHWTGEFYGIANVNRPMDFTVGGSGDVTVTVMPGAPATTPHGAISISGDVDVTIQDDGTTMVMSGTTDVLWQGPNGPLPTEHHPFSAAYQIEPADPGRCP